MNELELNYDPKIGITNLDDIKNLNTITKFQEAIKGILIVNINNGFRKRNPRKLCCIVLPLVSLLVIGCTLLAILTFPNSFGLIGGTITAIIFFIGGFCIYRKGSINYIKDIEKRIKKKTRDTCIIKFYHNEVPYEENIGCFGVTLTKESLIYIISDPEKLEVVKDQLAREDAEKKAKQIPVNLIPMPVFNNNMNAYPNYQMDNNLKTNNNIKNDIAEKYETQTEKIDFSENNLKEINTVYNVEKERIN